MSHELTLHFPDKDSVIVRYDGGATGSLKFVNPMGAKDRRDIQWYLEVYGTQSLGDTDDVVAKHTADKLPEWGKALFNAVFSDRAAERLFNRFQDGEDGTRLLTIDAEHPSILALPWELLHDPAQGGGYLFGENPRISIRRRVAGATGGRQPFRPTPKDMLHLLFVVSRPDGVNFLDPRADPQAVLDALDKHAPGRFTWEFLRPATLDALVERLEDKKRPPVDILHFDGHGVFDRDGGLPERVEEDPARLRRHYDPDVVRDRRAEPVPETSPPNTGYLVFEKPDGKPHLVSANDLGENLHRHRVALTVLSACQTAALGDNDEPMGSVAARLTAAGIPAVLAMTHSVLVHTTRTLFGEFYKDLAKGRGFGESLDNARRYLKNHPEKYEVRRNGAFVPLKLYDWFLPALYQSGPDTPLLKAQEGEGTQAEKVRRLTNVPPRPEPGFFGRTRELWDIECWFAGRTRRITITGFGGQGKTALALEAGRWLTRVGMFEAAVFVDYSRVQSLDAVAVAVNEIGSVLSQTLADAEAARKALRETPTLVILDNLEALSQQALHALLDAAVGWSEAGDSRVLCTTRISSFNHAAYPVKEALVHRRLLLRGLGPQDALDWFAELMKLPPPPTAPAPTRDEVAMIFGKVKFHPLSIRVIAEQLKTRRAADLANRLEDLLGDPGAWSAAVDEAKADRTLPELVASIRLSLDRLDEPAREMLPRLGVFQGGVLEEMVTRVTGIGEDSWPRLREQLEAAALIEPETLPGVVHAFLRFHPTLAPMLWAQLSEDERAGLGAARREHYAALARSLYFEDDRNPHQTRAIAMRELPNLLCAVHTALDARDPHAVEFADSVNKFLVDFGFGQEAEALLAKAQAAAGEKGSDSWFLAQSNLGERLRSEGRLAEAAEVCQRVLEGLGDKPSYKRAVTLGQLGRCYGASGHPDLAEQYQRDEIGVCDQLEQTDQVKRERGVALTDMADALMVQGKYAEARKAYEDGLNVSQKLDDLRGQGVTLGQLGTLAMLEGNLTEAAERYKEALAFFKQLGEPAMEAVAWHQLGMVFHKARQWDEAEKHYRESARIKEIQGNLVGAAKTWNQLAMVTEQAGKVKAAEMWCEKAIKGFRAVDDRTNLSTCLSNLANLLKNQPGRLAEARQLADEALVIDKTLDPGAAEIWTTYSILADISEKEAAEESASRGAELGAEAREYRRLAREARRNFAGTRHAIKQFVPVILAACMAALQPEERGILDQILPQLEQGDYAKLAAVIRRLLNGERDADALCDSLDLEDSMIIEAILAGIDDPSTLADFME